MSRRAVTGVTIAYTALLGAGVALALAVLLAACSASTGGSASTSATPTSGPTTSSSSGTSAPASPSAAATTGQSLYFLRDGKLGVAERAVTPTTMPATAAVKALLAGPSAAERAAELSSRIPAGTKLRSLVISGGVATANLTQAPDPAPADDGAAMAGTAELVYTLTRFPTVSAVTIKVDGTPWPPAGSASPSPVIHRRGDFRSLEPAIFVESPGVGGVIPDPFVLSGSASVFEGSFTAQLTDDGGRRVVRVTVQASRGAPGRGTFRQTVVYSTSATRGTLTVYSRSMEDGSRQNVIKIPVTFSP